MSNALVVVESLADRGPAGVGELARRTGIAKSTVQRCLETLAASGWITRLEDSRGHELATWQVADRLTLLFGQSGSPSLTDIARPFLDQLRDEVGEAVHLVVLEGSDVVLVERVPAPGAVQIVLPVGFRVPAYASATGKAILSKLDPEALNAHLPAELGKLTDSTISSRRALRAELRTVASRGWATNAGEWESSVVAVAAAVVVEGAPVAAVSASMVPGRMPAGRDVELGDAVQRVAGLVAAAIEAA